MRIRLTMFVVLGLVAAACGGEGAATTTTGTAQTTTTAGAATTTTASLATTTTADETATTLPQSPLADSVGPLVDLPPGASHDLVTFDGRAFSVSVPAPWTDREDQPWTSGEGYSVLATPDLSGWYGTWTMEGVFVALSETMDETVDGWLDRVYSIGAVDCVYIDRFDYSSHGLTGAFDLFDGCEGHDTAWITLAARADDNSYFLYVEMVLRSLADVAYLDAMVDSLEITGDLRP